MKQEYIIDIYDLMQMFGWSNVNSALPYLHIGYKGIVSRMVAGNLSMKDLLSKVNL